MGGDMKIQPRVDESGWRCAVERICGELGWQTRIESTSERTLLICPLPSDTHFAGVLFVISSVARRLMMYVAYRAKASSEYWNAMYEATTSINSGLLGGCLELDPERGEVRYRDGLLLV